MITRLFRSNYSIISCILWLALLFGIRSQLSLAHFSDSNVNGAAKIFESLSRTPFTETASLFVIIMLIAFSSYLFNNKYIIDHYRSFLPMLISISLLGSGVSIFTLHPAHLGILFLLLAFLPLFNLEKSLKAQNNLINSALILSFGSLLEPTLLYFLPLLWISAIIFKRLTIKTFLASLIGWFIPYILLIGIFFLTDQLEPWFKQYKLTFQIGNYALNEINQGLIVLLILVAINVPFVLYSLQVKTDRIKTFSRKVIGSVAVFFLLTVVLFTIGAIPFKAFYIYSSFPLSILFSIHLNHIRPRLAGLVIVMLLAGTLIGFISEF